MNTYEPLGRIRGVIPAARFIGHLILDVLGGLFVFRNVPDTVAVYGSARIKEDSPYYQQAVELSKKLAELDIPVITGGGPGIMEAANKGAASINKPSVGCHISLPFEQQQNKYLSTVYETKYFFVRKLLLRHSSKALIAFPGGFGTLDELFESITLIRTNCAPKMPTILVGKAYWQGLIDYLKDVMLPHGTISETDISQLHLTDDIDEVVKLIQASFEQK